MSEGFRTTANKRTRYTADDCKDHGIPMTSSEQTPKEYIITESIANHVCAILVNCGENKMANRVVSRPHPAPAPCPQHQIWQHCPVAGEGARKAREKTLEEVYDAMISSDEIRGDCMRDAIRVVNALRTTTPQSEQE